MQRIFSISGFRMASGNAATYVALLKAGSETEEKARKKVKHRGGEMVCYVVLDGIWEKAHIGHGLS